MARGTVPNNESTTMVTDQLEEAIGVLRQRAETPEWPAYHGAVMAILQIPVEKARAKKGMED